MCKLGTSCHHVLTSFHSYSSTPQRAPVHVDMCSAWKRRGWGWNPLLIAGSQHFAQWPGNHPQSGFTVTSSHWALSPVSPWVHPSCRPRWQRKTESTWSPHLRWPWRVELEVDWEATFREFLSLWDCLLTWECCVHLEAQFSEFFLMQNHGKDSLVQNATIQETQIHKNVKLSSSSFIQAMCIL